MRNRLLIPILVLAFMSFKLIAQERVGYGLTLPTEEQLKQIPYVPSFGLPPNFVLPKQKDLSDKMPPVGNQGYQGSCTAWAISYALKSYQEKKQNNWLFVENDSIKYNRICSPSFVFNLAKKMINNNNCLEGIPFVLGFKILNDFGTTFWTEFPYNDLDCITLPTQQIRDYAALNKISFVQALSPTNLDEIKYNISIETPVVVGVAVDDFFRPRGFDAFKANQHYTFVPQGLLNNYHAMLCVGYDNASETFKVMNSYGKMWGNDGYVDIPYSWFGSVVKEAYSVNDAYSYNLFIASTNKELESSKTEETFDTYSSWFKEGYYREFKNLQIGLTGLNVKDSSATVVYTDLDSNKTINIFNYKLNTPTSFYHNGKKITFTLTAIGKAGRNPLSKGAYFTVKIDNTVDKEFIDRIDNINSFKQQKDQFDTILQQQKQQQKQVQLQQQQRQR